ncbi:undecaprenyl-diphosphatase [Bacillus timonensis]|nr:undecaprenyl-diphosphatase [Bacillus timonensis]
MDIRLFKAINGLSNRVYFLDKLMILISNKMRYVFAFVLLVLWLKGKSNRTCSKKAFISAALSIILQFVIQSISFRPRPFMLNHVGILIPSKMNSSFPSRHTILVFSISTIILFYKQTLGRVLLLLSSLTAFSRIWVGHHYPTDILGSAFLGCFTSLCVHRFTKK